MAVSVQQKKSIPDIVKFLRTKDYKFIKELGRGACGETVLLHDEVIDEKFVCKKYAPFHDEHKELLFQNFLDEIKLLHLINHPNIVRVFNYYIYKEQLRGYILMELVDGYELGAYIIKYPEKINEIFLQVIEGFTYLERNNILHRDIRSQNIMVNNDGNAKIIDFGFGKQIQEQIDFDKSISLNWWCETPDEFKDKIYDFKTELYFVGKLFQQIIEENNIEHFKYKGELQAMCISNPNKRAASFGGIRQKILKDQFLTFDFDDKELGAYRLFSNSLFSVISKIAYDAKYFDDIDRVQQKLEELFRRVSLEEYVPQNHQVIRCFLTGNFYFNRNEFSVNILKGFLELLRSCSKEKKNIILSNIHTKLDSANRYGSPDDDEIPF